MRRLVFALALAACTAMPTPNPTAVGSPPTNLPAALPSATVASPTATQLPELTQTPALTQAPTPAPTLRQITTGGCCVQPFWSPDGSEVWYIDHPTADAPAGIWGVPLAGGAPKFISNRPGYYSKDGQYLVYPEKRVTYVQRVATSERWSLPIVGGRFVTLSPDSTHLVWQVNSSVVNLDGRTVDIWVAGLDGSDPHQAARLVGGGFSGWFPDSQRLLVTYRASVSADPQLGVLNLADGSLTTLTQAKGLRSVALSPQGGWVAYTVAFSGDPTRDGLWVIGTDGTHQLRLETFGSYHWRAEGQLLIMPLEPGAASHRLLEADLPSGTIHPLTDPAQTPFRIANGDWTVAPDGSAVVFLSEADRNLWVLDLPGQ